MTAPKREVMPSAKQIFQMKYKGEMNITGTIIKYTKVSETRAVELSHDPSFAGCEIYGVTVLDYDPVTKEITSPEGLSRPFVDGDCRVRAERYIRSLRYRHAYRNTPCSKEGCTNMAINTCGGCGEPFCKACGNANECCDLVCSNCFKEVADAVDL